MEHRNTMTETRFNVGQDFDEFEVSDDLKKNIKAFQTKHGLHLSKNAPTILKALKANKTKFGAYYCPCRVKKDESTICPCIYALDDIKRQGQCHCHLFEK